MILGGSLRIVALGCILASLPLAILTYPWLPVTVMEYSSNCGMDPAPWGTPSYHEGREIRCERVQFALLLYFMGSVSLCGLAAIVAKMLPWWAESATWVITVLTGLEIARFERAIIGQYTQAAYTVVAVYAPLGIAAIAVVAASARLGSHLLRSRIPDQGNDE